jgi:hypothetical protein
VSGCENIDLKLVYKIITNYWKLLSFPVGAIKNTSTRASFTRSNLLKCWVFCSITTSYCNSRNLSELEIKLEVERGTVFQNAVLVQLFVNFVATGLDLTFLYFNILTLDTSKSGIGMFFSGHPQKLGTCAWTISVQPSTSVSTRSIPIL